ncbi:MAG: GxxExxY protein [Candidatus Magasanikbacteria bacterium CG_4_9_14_0_2_um_filter_41_10]|uniref:GxxExxY protein n=1 Tax=Candidatus Magasanikbacteria bacterium CG_4_10_14_0_2_um_filter_41_31 TaxID=1974639 RepID=A0A2M7V4K6_9BACT|nr:MAG: GxxExxY protein [Candidatus Magasanikbacteria bacterium CG1_02_41_34]PIZ93496.1 MAG: GxxExxY protein [Candidatus Magasanikbacteria bacterium CG_4_10_14_0_2_um_filter_41_31]PJC53522.1 MAG: GxxExxY protein [Candidatus Magasanikbacteria bacterium CG_4_9_14_0_2_um_filter_41_10]
MQKEGIDNITAKIIRAYYTVYNTLGFGFLEKVYENAMILELQKMHIHGKCQVPLKVFYNGNTVGDYYADIIVEDLVVVELKAAEALREEHEAQLLNYLRATDIEYGLLLNFGKVPQIKRKVWTKTYLGKSR